MNAAVASTSTQILPHMVPQVLAGMSPEPPQSFFKKRNTWGCLGDRHRRSEALELGLRRWLIPFIKKQKETPGNSQE